LLAVWQQDSCAASWAAENVGCFTFTDGHGSADANDFFPTDTDGLGLGDHSWIGGSACFLGLPRGCYVELRREFKSRPLFDSRGIPELTSTHQWLLKSTRDASMDRTSFATMPIVKVNSRRAGEAKRWDYEPGTKLPLSQGDDAQ